MYRVEHRELTAQRTHATAMSNVFHCNLPPLNIHSLFRLFRQRHYDYAKELFWLGGATSPNFPCEITERALAHVIGDKAEQAYRRSDALEKRWRLMEAWAQYCEPKRTGNVVQILKDVRLRACELHRLNLPT
jgi:hypothetical protein